MRNELELDNTILQEVIIKKTVVRFYIFTKNKRRKLKLKKIQLKHTVVN